LSISRRLRLVNERVSAVGAAIFGVRPFAAEGRSPWGDGRPALAGREGSRRGGTPLRRARSRAQGAALVKNKVYKYWFKSRLKDRLAVAEKRAETLANADFLPVDSPSNVNRCAPHLSALCPSSVKDRAPHLSVVAPLKCQYRRALIPRLVHIICGKLA